MSILVDETTYVLIQGITGREGSRACKEMLSYGTNVIAGVTPKKGGQVVEGVPVYNNVKEALKKHPEITASLIAVPAAFVKQAATEAIEAGIPLINILTEHTPTQDSAVMIALARKKGVCIVGPSSVGIISPGKAKLGSIGSGSVKNLFVPGSIGVISKSGGMTAEIASILTRAGLGQSTVVGIGGDQLIGSDFVNMLSLFEADNETKAVVMFGEIGGTYEEQAARYLAEKKFTKPLIAVVAGKFTDSLAQETVLGHAGAIVSKGQGSYASKINLLKKAGALLPATLEEIPKLLSSS